MCSGEGLTVSAVLGTSGCLLSDSLWHERLRKILDAWFWDAPFISPLCLSILEICSPFRNHSELVVPVSSQNLEF